MNNICRLFQWSGIRSFSVDQVAMRTAFLAGASVLLAACSLADPDSIGASSRPIARAPATFEAYREATLSMMKESRAFRTDNKTSELQWNGPQEWRPPTFSGGNRPKKGILLVHGLGDSPFSFADVAPRLAQMGFLVRTVLLPGHGTRPDDLLDVTVGDWKRVVEEQAGTMKLDVEEMYLGGFSTGANLVLEYAYRDSDVAGLVLFSPGFKSQSPGWIAPALSKVRPWLSRPNSERANHTAVRYMIVPTNAFAQFYYSSQTARRYLVGLPYNKPVVMVVAEHDSVLDTKFLLQTFQTKFTNPASRLIWYGLPPAGIETSSRVLVRNDRFPNRRISQFSHMGVLFSPDNPLYGEAGSLKICLNSLRDEYTRACEAGAPVWYSDWGYRENDKIHARLTFNPYFAWQTSVLESVLNQGGEP